MAVRYSEKTGLPIGQGFYWKRGVVYVAIWHGGKKHTFCCGTEKPEEAIDYRKEKIAELVKEGDAPTEKGLRCEQLLNRYIECLKRKEQDRGVYMTADPKNTPSYKAGIQIKNLKPFFKLKPKDVTTDRLVAYRDERIKNVGVVTVNRELGYLRTAMNLGVKDGKVNPNHVPRNWPINITAERLAAKTSIITDEQYEKIMKVAADHLRPIIATVMYTGVRSKEIKFVRPEQVDFANSVIRLRAGETKEGDPRTVPMNDHVKAVLHEWWDKTKEQKPEWFFHFDGKQIKSWKTGWHAALRRCGLRVKVMNKDGTPKLNRKGKQVWKNLVRFHDTRRSAVTNMDALSVSESDMQVVSGHKTTKMIRQYNQSQAAVKRIRDAQNAAMRGTQPTTEPKTSNWKAELKELKAALDEGLLPEDVYKEQVKRVMDNR